MLLVFALTEALPGDAAVALAGDQPDPARIAAIREAMDLDRPAHERLADWATGLLHGDFGTSLTSGRPVTEYLTDGFGPTLLLAALTLALLIPLGLGLGVAGRSGSGKTTLARCLAGLHRDHDGEILLDGAALPRSLRHRDREQLAAVQYVFQDARAAFDEHRPVLDQVARTAVRLRGAAKEAARAEALAALVRLGLTDDQAHRRPGALSGGELQRAALARALLARPRILVCDEITSGLDTVTRRSILDLLAGLPADRDDLSLVLITHDPETARLAHRTAVVDAGEVVERAPSPLHGLL